MVTVGTDIDKFKMAARAAGYQYVVAENATAVNELGLVNAAWASGP